MYIGWFFFTFTIEYGSWAAIFEFWLLFYIGTVHTAAFELEKNETTIMYVSTLCFKTLFKQTEFRALTGPFLPVKYDEQSKLSRSKSPCME